MAQQDTIDTLRRAPVPAQKLLIDGAWQDGSGTPFAVTSPIDGSRLTTLEAATEADVERAVAAARLAFDSGVWSRAAPAARPLPSRTRP